MDPNISVITINGIPLLKIQWLPLIIKVIISGGMRSGEKLTVGYILLDSEEKSEGCLDRRNLDVFLPPILSRLVSSDIQFH